MAIDKYNQSVFLILKVAYLYYIENHPQNEIAEQLGISITTVSRLLNKAKEDKIVEFVIRDPYIECIRLEEKLRTFFKLKDVVIAPGITSQQEDLDLPAAEDNVKKLVALEGARYLQRIIRSHDILGVTWGSTVYHMINYLNPSQKVDAKFVTLHGSIACCENELDVRTLVSRMAKAFSGENYYLLTDALMSSKSAADIMKQERNNRKVFEMFSRINVSISGIGSFYPSPTSVLAGPEFMTPEELDALKRERVAGDIALRFIDQEGNECRTDLQDRMITIDLDQLRKIETKIVMASGEAKAHAVYSALKGNLINVLIIDYKLAVALISLMAEL
ncbi:sugar-binding transcriptional regulator [Hungatella hathewayi]|uniref:sugar-binding transcriptional regulator n=1 Tax=Hungatella hathewayi TaxID=154046 RepID=UPI00356761A3